jgi:hypothetical protein
LRPPRGRAGCEIAIAPILHHQELRHRLNLLIDRHFWLRSLARPSPASPLAFAFESEMRELVVDDV